MADLDFGKIKLYVGNYMTSGNNLQSWLRRLQAGPYRKAEEKIKERQEFVARFSANASKIQK